MSNKKAVESIEVKEKVIEVVEEVIEKPYTLRKLKDADLFPMLQILKKIGVKDFKDAFIQVVDAAENQEQMADIVKKVGVMTIIDIADILIGNLGKAETEIYDFWSNLSGIPVDEMKEMEFGTLPMMIYDTFAGVKDLSFFKVLSKLL